MHYLVDRNSPLRSRWWTVSGLSLHARVGGWDHAPGTATLVMVHGLGISGSYMVPLARHLCSEYRVVVVDLPGHGRSPTPRSAADVPALAAALGGLMDAAGIDRASLVANSLGCQTALHLAAVRPELVDRCVLVGPTMDPARRSVAGLVVRFLFDAIHEHPSLALLVATDFLRMHWRLIPEFRAMRRHDALALAPRITAPCLLVRGQHDPLVGAAWVRTLARALGGDVREVTGMGHGVHYSAAERVASMVRAFVPVATPQGTTPPVATPLVATPPEARLHL
jgi:2-hydroxy-6-oxonona-2,4-dienedioate hydrolase